MDDNLGHRRLSSQAFQNLTKEQNAFSVCISCDAEDAGAQPEDLVANHPGYGVASFPAGLAREHRQAVARVPEEGEIAHGHVIGEKSKRVRTALAKAAGMLVEP